MSTDIVQVNFRMPAALKERLEAASTENRRTLTAEIIARLEASFSLIPRLEAISARDDDLHARIAEMEADLTAFMLMEGRDPAEVRKMWTESAEKIKAERAAKKAQKP